MAENTEMKKLLDKLKDVDKQKNIYTTESKSPDQKKTFSDFLKDNKIKK